MRNYFGIIPSPIRDSRILPAQAKVLYSEISSRIDENNNCSFPLKHIADWQDVDSETIKRWLKSLADEKFIAFSFTIENDKELCRAELLFPQRPAIQEKEIVSNVKSEAKPLLTPAIETKKEKKQVDLTLTPEQIIRKHFYIEELKNEFKNLDLEGFELPNWSAKLQLRYKNNFIKDENVLLEHLRRWLRNSKHINLKSDISEI